MFFQNLAFILPSIQQFWLKRMLVFSHKIVFIENEAAILCLTMLGRAKLFASTIQCIILPLKSSVFLVHFSNTFSHVNKAFPKGNSQNDIVNLLVDFCLPHSKYRCMKICFYSRCYPNQNFSLISHSCRQCSTRVTLVLFLQHSCRTHVALVSLALLSCHSCRVRVARVALVFLLPGTRVVNQTRSMNGAKAREVIYLK